MYIYIQYTYITYIQFQYNPIYIYSIYISIILAIKSFYDHLTYASSTTTPLDTTSPNSQASQAVHPANLADLVRPSQEPLDTHPHCSCSGNRSHWSGRDLLTSGWLLAVKRAGFPLILPSKYEGKLWKWLRSRSPKIGTVGTVELCSCQQTQVYHKNLMFNSYGSCTCILLVNLKHCARRWAQDKHQL